MVGSLIAAGIGAAASLFGADKAEKSQDKALKTQKQQFAATKATLQPFIDQGTEANKRYSDFLGLNGPEAQKAAYAGLQTDPGFEQQVQYGLDQTNRIARARGQGLGGNVLAALSDYAGNQRYNYNQNYLNRLQSQGQQGLSGANALAGVGTNFANSASNAITSAGNAQAAGILGANNAFQQGFQNFQNQQFRNNALSAFAPSGALGFKTTLEPTAGAISF